MATDFESLVGGGACGVREHDHLLRIRCRLRSLHIQPFTVHSGRDCHTLNCGLMTCVSCLGYMILCSRTSNILELQLLYLGPTFRSVEDSKKKQGNQLT